MFGNSYFHWRRLCHRPGLRARPGQRTKHRPNVSRGQNNSLRGIVEKPALAIPKQESLVTLSSLGGEVRCLGTISSSSKVARIILNRNPGLPALGEGFDETLSELRDGGMFSFTWKPVTRTFEELVLAFYPSKMFSDDLYSWGLDRIASNLGAPDQKDGEKPSDYVIGDGSEVDYKLRLTIDRGLGRHGSDETRLTVT